MNPRTITVVAALSLLLATSSAFAGGWKSESSIRLFVPPAASAPADSSAPHYGDQVTFEVSTTATDRPQVILDCSQDGRWVSTAQAMFVPGTLFTLASGWWTGGAAECTATLGMTNAQGMKFRALASTSFHVDA